MFTKRVRIFIALYKKRQAKLGKLDFDILKLNTARK